MQADQKRIALVTGSARGLGYAIAQRLSQDNVRVVICDVDAEGANAAAARLGAEGAEATGMAADIADEGSVAALFDRLQKEIGRLDIVVNNAGVHPKVGGRKVPVAETPLDIWQQTIAVNLTGTFLVCRSAAPMLSQNGWGRIVNVASRAARTLTSVNNAPYAASKAGLLALSRSLAAELGAFGVTVNSVAPSRVDTDMSRNVANRAAMLAENARSSPLGRHGTPQDIANAVAFLCSDQAAFITGAILDVNGGTFMAS